MSFRRGGYSGHIAPRTGVLLPPRGGWSDDIPADSAPLQTRSLALPWPVSVGLHSQYCWIPKST